jgi:predicted O-methyltransferase YrrM
MGPAGDAADFAAEDEPLLAARANAAELGGTEPVDPEVGAALRFLASAVAAKTAVEIGTGCGSSGIWLLRGMQPGGTLTSVDTEPEYQRMARKAFAQAGFAPSQCRLILGRALEVLPRLSDGAYDMVFCDADARDYPDYLTAARRLLRPGGIVAFNNALRGAAGAGPALAGAVFDGAAADDAEFEETADVVPQVCDDERLVPLLMPLGSGLLCAVKRGG